VLTLGKGLGAGVALSAVLANRRACCFEPGDQGGTFNGNPLGAAVALRVLDVVTRPGFLEHAASMGAELGAGLEALAADMGGSVRGRGLLLAWVLDRDVAPAIAERSRELGLLVNAARPSVLRLMPSLRITHGEVTLALSLLRRAAQDVLAAAVPPPLLAADKSPSPRTQLK
jgi:acetylornithine/N-succinyldiaminopimelate aminotransferase